MQKLRGKDLHFGDIIFVDSRNPNDILARAVKVMENGGKYPTDKFVPNHCGIVIEENKDINKVGIIQSAWHGGVKIKPLNAWIKSSFINVIVKRYKEHFPDYKKRQMEVWLKNKLGLPYDVLSVLGIIVGYFLYQATDNPIIKKLIKHLPNLLDSKVRILCSELVFRAFLEVMAVVIWSGCHPSFVSPYDEFRSKKFRTVGRYFNFEYKNELKTQEEFPGMKRGDLILLYYKYDPIGWLIRLKTKSKWNHIGVALNETHMIDLRATKLRITHVEDFLKSSIYKIKLLRIPNLTEEAKEHLITTLEAQPAKRIYWKMLWKFFLLFFNTPSDICISCSEIIVKALKEKNIDLVPGKDVRLITPEDINRSKMVIPIWTYLNFE